MWQSEGSWWSCMGKRSGMSIVGPERRKLRSAELASERPVRFGDGTLMQATDGTLMQATEAATEAHRH